MIRKNMYPFISLMVTINDIIDKNATCTKDLQFYNLLITIYKNGSTNNPRNKQSFVAFKN